MSCNSLDNRHVVFLIFLKSYRASEIKKDIYLLSRVGDLINIFFHSPFIYFYYKYLHSIYSRCPHARCLFFSYIDDTLSDTVDNPLLIGSFVKSAGFADNCFLRWQKC